MFMVWRAVARVQLFEDLWTWTKLCSCGGGILFAISDFILGFNMFHSPIPYSHIVVMITYYAAQLGIALSVVDSTSIAIISAAHSIDNNQCCQHYEEDSNRIQQTSKERSGHVTLRTSYKKRNQLHLY
ncbi:Lysoplasmalogenase-like protein TMEM86A, partial [Stegodyphus mimosarum]